MTESKVVRVAAVVASILGACWGVSAHAQQNAANSNNNAVTNGGTSKAASTKSGSMLLQEIVVTAEHQRESLQNVPIAITAITPQQIRVMHLQNIKDLQFMTTDLTYGQGLNYQLPSIRGVGSFLTNPGVEQSIATYIDGSYVERAFGAMYNLVDLQSAQVLKGPQGTLYGRNATGGAIVLTTNNPTHQFEGHVSADVGSFSHAKLTAVLNTPLSSSVANRFAALYERNGGWVRDLNNGTMLGGSMDITLRDKIAYIPIDSPFSAVFEYEYDKYTQSQPINTETLPAVYCAFCGASQYTYPIADPYTTAVNIVQGGEWGADNTHFSDLHLRYAADKFTIENIAAYRTLTSYMPGDLDFTEVSGFNIYQQSGAHTFTDTLNFHTKLRGPVNVLAGLDYLKDSSYMKLWASNLPEPTPATLIDKKIPIPTTSYSGFAEVRVRPVQRLTLTAGARYTHDRRSYLGATVNFSSVTPRFVIAYNFGNTNVYVSYNKGFKAGGFNAPSTTVSVFKPETIKSYEAGLKYLSNDHRLRANIDVFRYEYHDIQVQSLNQANVANIASQNNAASATGSGVELEGQYVPIDAVHLFGGMSWLDAHFDNFANASVQVPVYNAAGQPIGFGVGPEDLSHTPLPRAPRWTANFGVTDRFPVAGQWKGDATVSLRYTSSFYFQAGAGGPLKADRQGGYTTGAFTARLYPEGSNYVLNFYVNNLTNAVYDNFRFSTAPFGALQDVAPPRTYGMGVTVTF